MPVWNERGTIEEIVRRVIAQPLDLELVVVDDGSTDGTREIVEAFSKSHPQVRVVFHPANRGKGAALRTGFQEARGEYVIVQDADLEYDPREYATLLEPLLDGRADVVYGSRFLGGPHRVLNHHHYLANQGLTFLSNLLTNLNLTDMETCYKVFRRNILPRLALREDRFGFEPEFTSRAARAGLRIYEVPISYSGRTYAEGKKIGWHDGVRALWVIVRCRFDGG